VTPYNPNVTAFLSPLGLETNSIAAAEQLARQVAAQASMLAFQDAFWLTGVAAFVMIPLVLLLQKPKAGAAAATGAD
jgi:DHA2 family multidrug resistance protein